MEKPGMKKRIRSSAPLPSGKLPMAMLQRLLELYTETSNGIRVGAGVGRDAVVIELDDRLLIAKTDPITFVADEIGHYALHINANDVACMGGVPKWFLATVLLPAGKTTEDQVERVFDQISRACRNLEVALCGGHTEVSQVVDQPVVAGCLLAEAPVDRRYSPQHIQPEDRIILTKGLAVEATSILGREKAEVLAREFEARFVERCKQFLFDPGISVLPEAKLAWDVPGIHALHDPTEGGLANALHELLEDTDLGVEVDLSEVTILPETKVICEQFGLDPLGIIASGALVIVGEESACERVSRRLHDSNLSATIIGHVLPKGEGRWLSDGSQRRPLPYFRCDEILRVLL